MGLAGYVDEREFVLLDHTPGSIFRWFQSLSTPDLAFVVIDPLDFKDNFPLSAVRRSTSFAGIDPDEKLVVLAICTFAPEEAPTANFLAPIGIGLSSRRGAQVIVHESGFGCAEPFL